MTRTTFWRQVAAGVLWATAVLAALRSEPMIRRRAGDRHSISHWGCGPWGCSATIPRLLAWQIPMVITALPASWLLIVHVPFIRRHSRIIGIVLVAGTVGWLAVGLLQSWQIGHIGSVDMAARRIVFLTVSGTSAVIPVILSAGVFLARPRRRTSGTNANCRADSEELEDFRDVGIPHVDTSAGP